MANWTFTFSADEQARAKAWMDKHAAEHDVKYTGAIGGRWEFAFFPTSIGDLKKVRCFCGAEEEVSDMCQPLEEQFAKMRKKPDEQNERTESEEAQDQTGPGDQGPGPSEAAGGSGDDPTPQG